VVLAFGFGFFALLLVLTEFNSGISELRSVMLFKRGASSSISTQAKAKDEENQEVSKEGSATTRAAGVDPGIMEKPSPMTNVFSWEHLSYTVNVSGDTRQLLNDVTGYVAPGKLTALLGVSGAGKACSSCPDVIQVLGLIWLDRQRC
jgi:ATP-binding cassette subfamily G (WHITE) protein 2 (SNQ2)